MKYLSEVQIQLVDEYTNYLTESEKANGKWVMFGCMALIGTYTTLGQIIP